MLTDYLYFQEIVDSHCEISFPECNTRTHQAILVLRILKFYTNKPNLWLDQPKSDLEGYQWWYHPPRRKIIRILEEKYILPCISCVQIPILKLTYPIGNVYLSGTNNVWHYIYNLKRQDDIKYCHTLSIIDTKQN